jgi:DNA-binding CsgD family transcriptional regulator/tetratricopeptide (TPR) repeat protein
MQVTLSAATGPLLERNEELVRVESALADACAGRGRFVVIEGPAGIGKTALLSAARTAATESGMRVLRSRSTELETNFAFGVVRQLFEPPLAEATEPDRADLLQGAAGVAADLLALPGAPSAGGAPSLGVDPSFAILHGLYWLCANLAAVGPLCLVVDDAHWADAASLRYLAFLLTRLDELDVALVVATRPAEMGTEAELLTAVTTDSSADVIRLAPLTRAAVVQMLEAGLGRAADADVVDTCLRVTGGTPFLVRELVTALSESGVGSGGETFGRSVRLRLLRLPESAGRLARALAILERSDLLAAAQLAELDEGEAANAADLLVAAGILDPGRPLTFVHPLVRNGIYAELSGASRADGHRRAAGLLAARPGSDAHVAEHLLVSEPAGDGWVVERLVAAAQVAGKEGAPESEAVFLRRAVAEPPAPDRRCRLLVDLGMAESSAGLPGWAEHLQQAVDAAANPVAAAEAALVLAHALNGAQRYDEAVEILDRAAATLGPQRIDLALQLEAAAVIAEMNDPASMPPVSRRRVALRARAADDPNAPPEVLAAAAFISVLSNEPAEIGANLATRALEATGSGLHRRGGRHWVSSTGWFSHALFALLWSERYGQLRPLVDASIVQARATGDRTRLAMGLANRGWLAFRCGDLASAEADSRTALAATELPAPSMFRVLNGAVLVKALVAQGKLDAAEEALVPLAREVESGSLLSPPLRLARGRLRVAQGRVAEGLEDILAVGVLLTRSLVTSPVLSWRSEAAFAELALGNRETAERLADEEVELARAFGTPRVLGVALRTAGVVAGGDRGMSCLREAIASFDRGQATLERARALADLGAMLRRRNRRAEAREPLREALDAAHQAGARPLAEYAETELRATGARPRRVALSGVDALTASERRVADFASHGLSNREIAQTLFVTARTVEGHLTSVFRKLHVESRDELPAALAVGAAVSS